MGLHIAEIQFADALPSFQAIRQQYQQQTGLDLRLIATLHLADSALVARLPTPSSILSLLQTDAAAVAELDACYEAQKESLVHHGQYEQAAALRDLLHEQKQPLNHISSLEVVVGHGEFYSIELSIQDLTIKVYQYTPYYYAVVSLIKTLVDLGGTYLHGSDQQTKHWHKLKKWQDYKWYNRPRK